MRFLRSVAAGVMTLTMVAFGMMMYLFNRNGGTGLNANLVHAPVLFVPLIVAFALGFGLGWWNLRPE
jgi:lipopolysaccharide export LptBFGC system permease protein LptF